MLLAVNSRQTAINKMGMRNVKVYLMNLFI